MAGMLGMFALNITMPITLVAVTDVLPGREGFSFGLTCAALIAGALPALVIAQARLSDPLVTAAVLGGATVLLAWALMPAAPGRPVVTLGLEGLDIEGGQR